MICPNCHKEVPDGSFECPYCSEALCATQCIDLGELSWCGVCGALVPPGASCCPKCGSPVPGARRGRHEAPREERREQEPGLESAIPPTGPDAVTATSANDMLPRLKQFIVAAVAAIAIVGGTAVAITHPWDPNANDISAKTPMDTSEAGNPDEVSSLDAQDKDERAAQTDAAAEDPIFDSLSSDYQKLVEVEKKVTASEGDLKSKGVSGTAEERSACLLEIKDVSLDVSNTISSISSTSDGAGVYADDKTNLTSLGNWLRNRCDALSAAWELSSSSADPASAQDQILAKISGNGYYKTLFDQNVDAWKPVSRAS